MAHHAIYTALACKTAAVSNVHHGSGNQGNCTDLDMFLADVVIIEGGLLEVCCWFCTHSSPACLEINCLCPSTRHTAEMLLPFNHQDHCPCVALQPSLLDLPRRLLLLERQRKVCISLMFYFLDVKPACSIILDSLGVEGPLQHIHLKA